MLRRGEFAEPEVPREILNRQLRSRHASMLALGGAIGTGLIIGSGPGLAASGPVGLLLSYIYVGSLCYAMMAVSHASVGLCLSIGSG